MQIPLTIKSETGLCTLVDPDMDQLEGAPPGHEPIHRPFCRLLAVLVPVDGHDGRDVLPGLGLPAV